MNKLKEVFKQLTDKLSRTVRYSPDQLERQIILAKIEAISEHVDNIALQLENQFNQLKEKKHVKKN